MMIRILPHLPDYQFLYTCPNCGCHIASIWRTFFTPHKPILVKCRHCDMIYPWKEPSHDQEAQESTRVVESPEDEIRNAIAAVTHG